MTHSAVEVCKHQPYVSLQLAIAVSINKFKFWWVGAGEQLRILSDVLHVLCKSVLLNANFFVVWTVIHKRIKVSDLWLLLFFFAAVRAEKSLFPGTG